MNNDCTCRIINKKKKLAVSYICRNENYTYFDIVLIMLHVLTIHTENFWYHL